MTAAGNQTFRRVRSVRRTTFGITAGVMATIGGLVFAGPASATIIPPTGGSWDHVWASVGGAATLYVKENADIFALCDTKADGQSAYAVIWYPASPKNGDFDLTVGGNGTCVVSTYVDHDIPEGDEVSVDVMSGYGSDNFHTTFINDH